ncbi:glycosyl hydrolase [Ureibacillus sinduriensis]|uniref:glycosyl hydrolase n=1 Tax=Ureibacillus sinduriensis TaxID=561440 RepID=UPI00068E792A|nr:glycosyl hydrolase [Ureibacillus sinduriensis]
MNKIYSAMMVIVFSLLCFSLLSEEVKANAWVDYKEGLKLYEKGNYSKAIPYLKRAAEESNNASYYRKLAEAYEGSGQYQKASDTLYTEAKIHYAIGQKSGDMKTYHAVIIMAERLKSELELYTEKQVQVQNTKTLAKYEPASGMYIGAFIDGDEPMMTYGNQKYTKFNSLTGKKHSTYFRYWKYGDPFPTEWAMQVKESGAAIHIALEPKTGLDKVKNDDYLKEFAQAAAATEMPIFLRFAGEMNGNWVKWNGNPSKYKEAFRTVSRVMKQEAKNVAMVWSPGSEPRDKMKDYYPGDEFVDWIGTSIYSVRFFNGNAKQSAEYVNPLELLDFIYKEYADRKPIMVSEYAATTFSKAGNMNTTDFGINKMKMLYHGAMLKYPRVKAINWFSLNALENADRPDRKLNNYSLTENKKLLTAYSNLIKNNYYLQDVENGPFAKTSRSASQTIIALEKQVIRQPVTIYAWAKTYDPKISKIIFKLDGKYLGESSAYPFAIKINPSQYQNGQHKLQAIVFDSKGKVAIKKTVAFQTAKN